MASVLIKELYLDINIHRVECHMKIHTQKEMAIVKTETEIEILLTQDKEQLKVQKFEGGKERSLSIGFRASIAQPTPWFWNSNL